MPMLERIKSKMEYERAARYMAEALLLPKDVFRQELLDADYSHISPAERKAFVHRMAGKYDVEPDVIFRRIDELKVIDGSEEAGHEGGASE